MKYVIAIPDGAADDPRPELDGKTPLEKARTPNMDALTREGRLGLVRTIPPGQSPGSDIAMLSILGYDPARYFTGRAPLEAASMGVTLDSRDVAFRCNLVTVEDDTLVDYSADEISTEEAHALMAVIREKLATRRIEFYPGVSYRNLMVWRDGSDDLRTVPPHDMMGQPIKPNLPTGDGEDMLRSLMEASRELLEDHGINKRRLDQGKRPANMIWFWGQGRSPNLPSLVLRFGVAGCAIAAVDLVRGIARLAGLAIPNVPGATGNLNTDFAAKGEAAVQALERYDLLLVHVEAPDEAAHHADPEAKVWAIEQVDEKVLGPIVQALRRTAHRILLLPDHRTTIESRTHEEGPVPFVLAGEGIRARGASKFCEAAAEETGIVVEQGHRLIEELFSR
jgi:2,3-bisphosphoglycerate-independent phosphoglycerate mutase